jgi:hypothetical protein
LFLNFRTSGQLNKEKSISLYPPFSLHLLI